MSIVAPSDMIERVAPQEIQQIDPQYMAAIVAPPITNKLATNIRWHDLAARVVSTRRVIKQVVHPTS